jgi:hypothetical protein
MDGRGLRFPSLSLLCPSDRLVMSLSLDQSTPCRLRQHLAPSLGEENGQLELAHLPRLYPQPVTATVASPPLSPTPAPLACANGCPGCRTHTPPPDEHNHSPEPPLSLSLFLGYRSSTPCTRYRGASLVFQGPSTLSPSLSSLIRTPPTPLPPPWSREPKALSSIQTSP